MTVLEFEIWELPPLANSSVYRGHWRAKQRNAKYWRELTAKAARAHTGPTRPKLEKAKVILTRCSFRACDYDGRVHSFKPVLDGLVDAGILVDDNDQVIVERHYPWEKVGKNDCRIRIRVESIE